MDRRLQRAHVNLARHGTLENHAEHVRVVVHRDDARFAFLLRQITRPELLVEPNAGLLRPARLVPDVHGDLGLIADTDRDEPTDRVLLFRRRHTLGDFGKDPVTHARAIQQSIVFHEFRLCAE